MVFVSTLVHAAFYSPPEEEITPARVGVTTTNNTSPQSPNTPTRLLIPSIDVDANVQRVGIGKSGNMAVPSNFTDVAWYRYGPTPGQPGSAVIDGHVDNGFGLDAVFKHIAELTSGDDIYIVKKDNTRVHFVIQSIQTYAADEVPLDLLFNRTDQARLNLITCAGTWIRDSKNVRRTYGGVCNPCALMTKRAFFGIVFWTRG
jgi:sortase (surface protein transpeptidase)